MEAVHERAGSVAQVKNVTIRLRLFAAAREAAGQDAAVLELPDPAVAADVWPAALLAFPRLAALRDSAVLAVNLEYALPDHPLAPDDEVAIIPPISGGGPAGKRQHG